MRKKDDLHWVKKVEQRTSQYMEKDIVSIITDVRFPNEIDYVHKMGGKVIHLTMVGNKPANEYEVKNDPLLKEKADYKLEWEHYGEGELYKCMVHVESAIRYFYG